MSIPSVHGILKVWTKTPGTEGDRYMGAIAILDGSLGERQPIFRSFERVRTGAPTSTRTNIAACLRICLASHDATFIAVILYA